MRTTVVCVALTLLITTNGNSQESASPAEVNNYPQVLVETNVGNFTIELFSERSPLTVANFLEYVEAGFYSDSVFHRVVAGFVAQAGGYDSKYQKKAARPAIANESGNGLSNLRAYVAMARTSEPHTADSQFYINLTDNSALDPRPTRWGYTVFGRVIDGMTVIDDIGYRATGRGPVPELIRDVPVEPIVITKIARITGNAPTAAAPEAAK